MSSLTEEWQLKTHNGIKYIVDIKNFKKKMKSLKPGCSIYSKEFHVQESRFLIDIYPNGNSHDEKGHVSVYLTNRSDGRVKARCNFTVGDYNLELGDHYYQAYDSDDESDASWGIGTFVSHVRCNKRDLLTPDGTFTLEADIEVLEQEVTGYSKDPSEEIKDLKTLVQMINEVVSEQKTEIQDLKTSVKRNNHDLKNEIDDLKDMILSLNMSVHPKESTLRSECPSCMEILRPPMRLMQCGQGHIVCEDCYTRLEEMECPTCRGDITGRPTELERVLGLV